MYDYATDARYNTEMPHNIFLYIGIYLAAVSLLAIGQVIYDKHSARKDSRRISERMLLFVSAIGGSVAMLVAMHLIRHKTKHAKFMIGIPIIIILQAATVLFIWWKLAMV